jgi:hypothetical protein
MLEQPLRKTNRVTVIHPDGLVDRPHSLTPRTWRRQSFVPLALLGL